jgi:hypothetical protein
VGGSESDALALLDSVRASLGLPVLSLDLTSVEIVTELRDAHALLMMLSSLLANQPGSQVHDDVRHNWNKALRRRGWRSLPALEASTSLVAATAAGARAEPVRDFLACFGVAFSAAGCAPESLARAHALCMELQRDVDALRALPLLAPESYARRHAALTARWNELAETASDLPRLGSSH